MYYSGTVYHGPELEQNEYEPSTNGNCTITPPLKKNLAIHVILPYAVCVASHRGTTMSYLTHPIQKGTVVWLHPFFDEDSGELIEGRVQAEILECYCKKDPFYYRVCIKPECRDDEDPDGLREGVTADQIESIVV